MRLPRSSARLPVLMRRTVRRDPTARLVSAFLFRVRARRAHDIPSKYIVMTQINENLGQGGRYVSLFPCARGVAFVGLP